MLAYTGDTRDPWIIERMVQHGVGVVVMAEEIAKSMLAPIRAKRRRPDVATPGPSLTKLRRLLRTWPRWFMDNGAFGAWRRGVRFDVPSWAMSVAVLENVRQLDPVNPPEELPDFVVLPDIIGGGMQSHDFSIAALHAMLADGISPALGFALVVQEGMTPENLPWDEPWDTLFIGGAALDWKMSTAPRWLEAAREHDRWVHVGRVGTMERVLEARHIGVDSIDSSLPLFSHEQTARFIRALTEPLEELTGRAASRARQTRVHYR